MTYHPPKHHFRNTRMRLIKNIIREHGPISIAGIHAHLKYAIGHNRITDMTPNEVSGLVNHGMKDAVERIGKRYILRGTSHD